MKSSLSFSLDQKKQVYLIVLEYYKQCDDRIKTEKDKDFEAFFEEVGHKEEFLNLRPRIKFIYLDHDGDIRTN